MERAGSAAGDQAKRSRGGRPAKSGPSPVWRPGVAASSADARAVSGLRPEAISSCQELADRRKCRESAARRRKENAAAERREAPPVGVSHRRSPAIRRWTCPRGGHGVRRSAPASVGALLPLIFRGTEETK